MNKKLLFALLLLGSVAFAQPFGKRSGGGGHRHDFDHHHHDHEDGCDHEHHAPLDTVEFKILLVAAGMGLAIYVMNKKF